MAPSRKGLYTQCIDCRFKVIFPKVKYPCTYSHRIIRGNVKLERDFKECLKYEKNELIIKDII